MEAHARLFNKTVNDAPGGGLVLARLGKYAFECSTIQDVRGGTRGGADANSGDESTLAAERVVATLRQDIVEARLRPGARLPDQRLAERFRVSRNTIRDALRLLVAEGLVVSRMHAGSAVCRLRPEDVRDIYAVRRVLELAAIHASALAAEERLAEVERAVERAEQAVDNQRWSEVGTASLDFHRAVVDLHSSARLSAFFGTIIAQLRLAFAEMDDERAFQVLWIPRDRMICEFVLSGRREEASAELERYLDDSEQTVIDVVRGAGRRRPPIDDFPLTAVSGFSE